MIQAKRDGNMRVEIIHRPASIRNLGVLSLLCVVTCVGGGCTSTRSNMTPGKMEWIQPTSDAPRVGKAYLMRGWIGVFSGGMDALTEKIDKSGVRAHVFQEDQVHLIAQTLAKKYSEAGPDHEPIVLIGHSLGADDAITEARELDKVGVPVDLLVTIDATLPSKVPKNVKLCYNYYQPSMLDVLGVFRGVPLETEPGFAGKLYNMDVRKEYKNLLEPDTNHVNIDKNTKIHADIIAKIMPVCPPRQQWVAARAPALAGAKLAPTTAPAARPTAAIPRVTADPAVSSATVAR
jgi:hypothetical protein